MKKLMISALCALPLLASADTVTLKSGTILTGKVLGNKDGVVKFESDDFGVLDVKPVAVSIIKDVNEKPMPIETIKVIPKEPETWHGSINGAFLAARGNTHENTWSIFGDVNRRWDDDRLKALAGYYFSESGKSKSDKEKTTDRIEVEAQHDHFWFEKIYNYESIRYDRDAIQELNARYRLGLGGGFQWLDGYVHEATGKWSFNQEAGVNWVKEEYEHGGDAAKDGFAALRYAHHLTYLPKWNDGVDGFHNFEYLPDVDDWDKYLIKADVGFNAKLIKDFTLVAKIEWDFNSLPADDRRKSDLRYILGLGYKW